MPEYKPDMTLWQAIKYLVRGRLRQHTHCDTCGGAVLDGRPECRTCSWKAAWKKET